MPNLTARVLSLLILSLLPPALVAQVRIAHISDIHLHNPAAPNARPRLVAIVASINEKPPDAVFVTGDMAEDDAGAFEVKQILATITAPLFYVAGNHDTNGADVARYRAIFGGDYYKLEINNLAIFVLNSQLLGNFSDPRAVVPLPMNPIAQAEGELMLQWLAQQTANPGQIAVAFQHVPLFFTETMPNRGPYWVINEPSLSRELAEFRRLGIRHLFAGHWHMRDTAEEPETAVPDPTNEPEELIQHVAPSVALPLFGGQPGYSVHTISAKGAVSTELVAPAADLTLRMSAPQKMGSGDNLTYSMMVKNMGPRKASGVVLTDTLPGGQAFVSASSNQGTCSGSNLVICDLGILPSQAETEVKITLQAQGAGTMTNTAAVAANQYDPNETNNQASAATVVENRDFTLQVSPATASTTTGNSATYTVTVTPTTAGFPHTVALSCSGLPAPATCSFTPSQVVPGNQAKTSALVISGVNSAMAQSSTPAFGWILGMGVIVFGLTVCSDRKRGRRVFYAALLLVAIGCGSGARDGRENSSRVLTITVAGTSGTIQRSATATLLVK